jgi:hypothetical protein
MFVHGLNGGNLENIPMSGFNLAIAFNGNAPPVNSDEDTAGLFFSEILVGVDVG